VLLSESRAIIDDLSVILHGFMLQIIYTTVSELNGLNNLSFVFDCSHASPSIVQPFNWGKHWYKYII